MKVKNNESKRTHYFVLLNLISMLTESTYINISSRFKSLHKGYNIEKGYPMTHVYFRTAYGKNY